MLVFEYAYDICIAAEITPVVTFLCRTMDLPVPAADLVAKFLGNRTRDAQEGLINIFYFQNTT